MILSFRKVVRFSLKEGLQKGENMQVNSSVNTSYYTPYQSNTNVKYCAGSTQTENGRNKQVSTERKMNAPMVNGLYINVDPRGEIANAAYWEEKAKKLNYLENTIRSYYAKAHEENLSFENPYMHIVAKYKLSDSPYFRSDMSEDERNMSFRQERALLWGSGLQLNDPYALAAVGGQGDIEGEAKEAVRKKLEQVTEEYQTKMGGDSSYESMLQKMKNRFDGVMLESMQAHMIDKIG